MWWLWIVLGVPAYCAIGAFTALVCMRNWVAHGSVLNGDRKVAAAFTGFFWLPVGMFIAMVGYVSAPKTVKPRDGMTKAQKERRERLECERVDIALDAMEHENRIQREQFHRRQITEIENLKP